MRKTIHSLYLWIRFDFSIESKSNLPLRFTLKNSRPFILSKFFEEALLETTYPESSN